MKGLPPVAMRSSTEVWLWTAEVPPAEEPFAELLSAERCLSVGLSAEEPSSLVERSFVTGRRSVVEPSAAPPSVEELRSSTAL